MFKSFPVLICLLLFWPLSLAKFKSLNCEVYDKELTRVELCQIKAVSRSRNYVNIIYLLYKNINSIQVRFQLFKRANGWHPFLYDIKFDGCKYLKTSQNLIVKIAFGYMKPFTNLNHSCPYLAGTKLIVKDYDLDVAKVRERFPIDNGEYLAQVSFYVKNELKFKVNGSINYFDYKDQ